MPTKRFFSSEPTARGDQIASYAREYYEKNRESWWDRHRPSADRNGSHADEWMIGFLNEINNIQEEAARSVVSEIKKVQKTGFAPKKPRRKKPSV